VRPVRFSILDAPGWPQGDWHVSAIRRDSTLIQPAPKRFFWRTSDINAAGDHLLLSLPDYGCGEIGQIRIMRQRIGDLGVNEIELPRNRCVEGRKVVLELDLDGVESLANFAL
jgi:hypothetical protein